MFVDVQVPQECSVKDLERFEALVLQGGEVDAKGLSARIAAAKVLAFVRDGDTIVAVAALKNAFPSYRTKIGMLAEFVLDEARYPFELGWLFVLPDYRGRGFSYSLAKACLDTAPGVGVFGTTRESNEPMRRSFVRCGFRQVGKVYPSVRGGEDLVMFVRDA